jgi:hypothetical protein
MRGLDGADQILTKMRLRHRSQSGIKYTKTKAIANATDVISVEWSCEKPWR